MHSRFARETVFKPDISLPVEVQGQLRLDAPTGRSVGLTADGTTLRLDLPGWAEARTMIPRGFGARSATIRNLADTLSAYGLTLSLQSEGAVFCQVGRGVRPTWLARLLGLAPARIPLSAIRLLFRR